MGFNSTNAMTWYIKKVRLGFRDRSSFTEIRKKGDPVKENAPAKFGLFVKKLVVEGPPVGLNVEIMVCEDLENKGAPIYRDSST